MMVYANQDFKNVMYELQGDAESGYSAKEWTDVKHTMGFAFPNLPYLIDSKNALQFTESKPIFRFIAKEFKVGVQSNAELAVADMLMDIIHNSVRDPYIELMYGPGFQGHASDEVYDEKKAEYFAKTLPAALKPIDAFMKNKQFICGETISYADFSLYYLLFAHTKFNGDCLKEFANLQRFVDGFEKLEFMERWNKTEFSKLPINNKIARFVE